MPPHITTLGELLDEYPELRINNYAFRLHKLRRPNLSFNFGNAEDNAPTWLEKTDDECFEELCKRCATRPAFRFRLPAPATRAQPQVGDLLQLFYDSLTGFGTFGYLHRDHRTRYHFLRLYEDSNSPPTSQRGDSVDVPVGEVLDQHPEIRVYANFD